MYQVDERGVQVLGASGHKEIGRWFSRSQGSQYLLSRLCPIALSKSEADDEMCHPWDDLQPSPGSPIPISDDDCEKEQDPSLGPCTGRLERISLDANGDVRACIEAKKKEAIAKRTAKRARRTKNERVPGRTYR